MLVNAGQEGNQRYLKYLEILLQGDVLVHEVDQEIIAVAVVMIEELDQEVLDIDTAGLDQMIAEKTTEGTVEVIAVMIVVTE